MIFNKIIYLDTIDSTNTYLKIGKFEDRTIVYTFNQAKGRGRGQKEWLGFNNKDLAISILFKPNININNSIWYIAACSLALIKVLDRLNIKNTWIKWPNDIYIKNDKLAGVLAESIWHEDKLDRLIVGIGININSEKEDLAALDKKAVSLFITSKKKYNLYDFFCIYKNELSKWFYLLIEKKNIFKIRNCWLKKCKIINKNVEWINNDKIIKGKIIKIELDGTLLLKTNDKIFKITSGEIKLVTKLNVAAAP